MTDPLKQAWTSVLGKDEAEIQGDTNFFEVGGDSVLAIRLAAEANSAGLRLNAQAVFQHPRFEDMKTAADSSADTSADESQQNDGDQAQHQSKTSSNHLSTLEAYRLVSGCLAQCNLDGALLEDIRPCAPFQRELMRASHDLGCWTFQAVFEISKNAEERAKRLVDNLHTRNAVFRTRIAQYGTDLYQIVSKAPLEWQTVEESLEVFKAKELPKRMSYGDPLSRCAIVRDNSRKATFVVWTQTHAIYDRWSKMHVLQDIQDGFLDPAAFLASPNRTPFDDFVTALESQDQQKGIAYWKRQLEGLQHHGKLLEAPPNQQFKTSETKTVRKTTVYRKPENTHITFATVAQVAWAFVLSKECKLNDIFYTSFRSCRQMDIPGIDTIIGPCWSMVPVRLKLNTEETLENLLQKVHKTMVEGIPHEPYGPIALDEYFGHKGYLQSVLLPQPPQPDTFSMTVKAKDEKTSEEVTLRSAEEFWTQTRGHFGLYIMMTPKGKDLELWARFDEKVIDQERSSRLLEEYADTMENLFTCSWKDTKISTILPNLPEPQQHENASDKKETNGFHHDEDDTEYELEGVDKSSPATLTHLLNQKSSESLACIIPSEDKTFEVSYADLEKHIQSFQKSLAEVGIKHKSAVSMSLGNTYELVVAFQASTRQRAIAAPLNPTYKQDEFEFYVDDISSSIVLIRKGSFKDDHPAVAAARKYEAAIAEVYWSSEKHEVVLDVKEEGKLSSTKDKEILTAEEDDIALVLHTSGTTGRPKAVPLTHKNLISNIKNICNTYRLRPRDRTLLIMPLFHVHGLLASFLSPLHSGGAAIIPERLTPQFWSQFAEFGATWYTATPTMHRMIVQFPLPESGLPQIRFIRSCSSQLAPALFKQLEEKFHAPVLESYAMTEASHMMTSNMLPPGKRYPGSVGKPQIDLKILDDEGGEVEQGNIGEVSIRGPNVTKGYLNNDEANKSSFTAEGFFRTGDQGKLDENGYLVLTGRLKELINKGGENISPVELDNAISQHEDIAESVSFAIDDEDYGQDVGCAIKTKDDKEIDVKSLRAWISERLAAHKVPKKIWFPDEIPKTATGKVQRKMVAEKMSNEQAA